MTYTINTQKLDDVIVMFRDQVDVRAQATEIHDSIIADWHEGEEHQQWLEDADAQEIVDWLASFYN